MSEAEVNRHTGADEQSDGFVVPGLLPVGGANTVPVSNGAGGIVWQQIGDAQVAVGAAIQLSKLETDPRDNGHIVALAQADYSNVLGGTTQGPGPATANLGGWTSAYVSSGLTGTPQLRLYIALRITAYGGAGQVVNVVGSGVRYAAGVGPPGAVTVIGPTTVQIVQGTNAAGLYFSDSGWVDTVAQQELLQVQIQNNWTLATRPTGSAFIALVHRMRA
jgi:hypothetical protein